MNSIYHVPCLLFSCPGANILPSCHRFRLATIPFCLFSHVPAPISCFSATDSALPQSPCACFLMSRRRYPAFLPQILPCHNPLLLVFSCPGGYILPFCHRFQPGLATCACFFHVPKPISYLPATVFGLPQSPFNQPRLVTVMFKKIPESRDSTLGAAFKAPGQPLAPVSF